MKGHGLRFHPLEEPVFQKLKLRSTFELGKWDQQYFDQPSLADFAIEIDEEVYRQLAFWAESLAGELFRAEEEILTRPELLAQLDLPRTVRRALKRQSGGSGPPAPRLCRFDFHPTRDGWRISEVNSDVPGGLLESDGLPPLLAEAVPGLTYLPNTTALYIDDLLGPESMESPIGLLHASAYTDDRQVMLYLQRELERRGQVAVLLSPDNLHWAKNGVSARTDWYAGPLARLIRF